jgi:hypothetical protein
MINWVVFLNTIIMLIFIFTVLYILIFKGKYIKRGKVNHEKNNKRK